MSRSVLPRSPSSRPSLLASAVLAVLVALAAGLLTAAPAGAAQGGLLDRAVAIVDQAQPGAVLRVVTTTNGVGGRPDVRTRVAPDRAAAIELVEQALADPGVDSVSLARTVRATASNDTYRSRQWALTRLQAETLWKRADGAATSGTRRAVVAVLDTGVDAGHPDLSGNVQGGRDEVDPGTSAADPNGHGTHVAGIVAAVANNRRGVAGLAPRASVLPVRVMDARGSGTSDDLARGIVWAADRKVHVISMSLSFTGSDPAVASAVSYARRKGVLVVAAAGNSGCGLLLRTPEYPAAYPGVVGVGSVDERSQVSSFSSCGSWVDVAAPGSGIWSTTPATNRLGCSGSYCSLSGTSMATPYVAAAAALAMSRRGWSAETVAARIERTARDLGAAGKDERYGSGLLDARALVG